MSKISLVALLFCTAFSVYAENSNVPEIQAEFVKTPLEEVVNALGASAGINFSSTVESTKPITLSVRMKPFDALQKVCRENGLKLEQSGELWTVSEDANAHLLSKEYELKFVHFGTQKSSFERLIEDLKAKITQRTGENSAHVSYDSDTNKLFVIASQKGQDCIANYLASIDKELPIIEMQLMFMTSSHNPTEELGIDWSGSMNGGYEVGISRILGTPRLGIINTKAFLLKLKGLNKASDSDTKSYPILTSYPNREVEVRFTKNEPIVDLTTDTQVQTNVTNIGSGTTNTVQIKQEEVGTIIKLFPRLIKETVALDIEIDLSSILSYKTINGNDYPIIGKTKYAGQTFVDSGFTVIVGGLEELLVTESQHGLNGFENIPFLGWIFKDKTKEFKNQKISMYVSVRLLDRKGNVIEKENSDDLVSQLNAKADAIENAFLEKEVA